MATITQELLGNLSGNDSDIDGRALNPGPSTWVKASGTSNVDAIDSSPDYLTGSNSTATAVYRTNQLAPSRNDEVEVTIRWTSFTNAFAGVLLGITGPTDNLTWYGFYVNGSSPFPYRINKLDFNASIDFNLDVTQATAGVSLATNTDYQMRLTRTDNGNGTVTLRGYINGTQVISWTDDGTTNGAILPAGYAGIRLRSLSRITAFEHRSIGLGVQNSTHAHTASSPLLGLAGPLAIASAVSAHVSTSPTTVGLPIMPAATRFCADRCFHPNSWDGDTARQFDGVTEHKQLASVISGFKIAYANWWVKSESSFPAAVFPNCTEVNGTQTLLIRAAIEYPLGTYTEVTWGGSATLSLAAGATTFSDDISVIPPKGATFRVHVYGSTNGSAYGIPYYWGNEAVATTAVDVHNYSTVSGVTIDYHMQYHPAPAYNQNVMYPPVAIVGVTTSPSVAIFGDSIAHGWLDVANIDEYHGAIGYYSASLAALGIPHANYAQPAEAGYLFVSNSAKRRALINAYASHAICNFWGNDFSAGRSFSQLQAMVTDIAGLIDPQLSWTCAMPATDSTNNWADEAQQTTGGTADENAHTDFNNYLLGGVPGIAHVFNPRPAVQGTVNQHKWKGAAPPLTPDGIHLARAGVKAIVDAGIINTSLVAYTPITISNGAHAHAAGSPAITAAGPIAASAGVHGHVAGSPSLTSVAGFLPANAIHAHSAVQPSILSKAALSLSGALHGVLSTSPAVVGTLLPNFSAHAHTASSPAVATTSPLSVSNALHAHIAEAVGIVPRALFAIANGSHAHVAGSPSLTFDALDILIDSATSAHAAFSPTMVSHAALVVAFASHAHTASSPSLASKAVLGILPASHALLTIDPVIGTRNAIGVDTAVHSHLASQPPIGTRSFLAANDGVHLHQANSPVVVPYWSMLIQGALHAHTSPGPSMASRNAAAIENGAHAHSGGTPTISAKWSPAISAAVHAHLAGQPAILPSFPVQAQAALHLHTAGQPAIGAVHPLTPAGALHAVESSNPTIGTSSLLAPMSALHAMGSSGPAIGARWSVLPDGGHHIHTASAVNIGSAAVLLPANTDHAHVASIVAIGNNAVLVASDARNAISSSGPALLMHWPLQVASGVHAHQAGFVTVRVPKADPGAFFAFF